MLQRAWMRADLWHCRHPGLESRNDKRGTNWCIDGFNISHNWVLMKEKSAPFILNCPSISRLLKRIAKRTVIYQFSISSAYPGLHHHPPAGVRPHHQAALHRDRRAHLWHRLRGEEHLGNLLWISFHFQDVCTTVPEPVCQTGDENNLKRSKTFQFNLLMWFQSTSPPAELWARSSAPPCWSTSARKDNYSRP